MSTQNSAGDDPPVCLHLLADTIDLVTLCNDTGCRHIDPIVCHKNVCKKLHIPYLDDDLQQQPEQPAAADPRTFPVPIPIGGEELPSLRPSPSSSSSVVVGNDDGVELLLGIRRPRAPAASAAVIGNQPQLVQFAELLRQRFMAAGTDDAIELRSSGNRIQYQGQGPGSLRIRPPARVQAAAAAAIRNQPQPVHFAEPLRQKVVAATRGRATNARDFQLAISKQLEASDVSMHHARLSIPDGKRSKLVTEAEMANLAVEAFVVVDRRSGQAKAIEDAVRVAKWNGVFVLSGRGWKTCVGMAGLEKGSKVELWMFRYGVERRGFVAVVH